MKPEGRNYNRNNIYRPRLPGETEFIVHYPVPNGLCLLVGPSGAGKTMYCWQFLRDGLRYGDKCVLISSGLTEDQFERLSSKLELDVNQNFKFISMCSPTSSPNDTLARMSAVLTQVQDLIKKMHIDVSQRDESVRIVVDSLTEISLLTSENDLIKFVRDLGSLLKGGRALAVCVLVSSDEPLRSKLNVLAESALEMKLEEDENGSLNRRIRLLFAKGIDHKTLWVKFKIANNGKLVFSNKTSSPLTSVTCTLCGKDVMGTPILESDFVFDSISCAETYRKLTSAYGSSISEIGLPTEAFNVSFFFIDIVGLSDPILSVKKQIQKIQTLNRLIASCDAFKNVREKKIVLPTGDGMAIGFLLNPELPLNLAIQLHNLLRDYNIQEGTNSENQIGVRIGLGSGPVFTVTDMNNVQNVWGPGIILARRVMDAGDSGHILLADKLAEELIALKDEYRSIIRPICQQYEIKHGQKITLYSAYSNNFGRRELPSKVPRIKL